MAEHIAGLEEMLPALEAERGQIEARLRDVVEREERIKTAVSALRGKVAKPVAPPVKQTGKSPPSQRMQDDIYAVIARAPEPISVQEITDLVDVTRSAVQNCVTYLRNIERIRVAAKRGVTKLYCPMPT